MPDHVLPPRVLVDPACDICDLYAFPSPERPGNLVLVMTVLPRAGSRAFFSHSVLCRFRLRPVSIAGLGPRSRFAVAPGGRELVVDCSFSRPAQRSGSDTLAQEGRCTLHAGDGVSVAVHDRRGGAGKSVRMFAGLVSDPFIFQYESLFKTVATGRIAFQTQAKNSLEGANVLGLVIEVEGSRWLAGGPLFAVVGETLAAAGSRARFERVGRPEVKNISIQGSQHGAFEGGVDVRSLYDQEDAFALDQAHADTYRARLNANFKFFDGLDGKIDWPPDPTGKHPLVDLLLDDYLVVDVSKPFCLGSYFEIEQAMLDGQGHQTCGGRTLNDDVLDTYYTLLINARNGPRISDGVDQATVPASNLFPYLATPNLPRGKGRLGRAARADGAADARSDRPSSL